jgi:hypothetical protein
MIALQRTLAPRTLVDQEELMDTVNRWANQAADLSEANLARMQVFLRAQQRRYAQAVEASEQVGVEQGDR